MPSARISTTPITAGNLCPKPKTTGAHYSGYRKSSSTKKGKPPYGSSTTANKPSFPWRLKASPEKECLSHGKAIRHTGPRSLTGTKNRPSKHDANSFLKRKIINHTYSIIYKPSKTSKCKLKYLETTQKHT